MIEKCDKRDAAIMADCFSQGYLLPDWCLNHKYSRIKVLSYDSDVLWNIRAQFIYSKSYLNVDYNLIGTQADVNYFTHSTIPKPSFKQFNFDRDYYEYDIVVVYTNKTIPIVGNAIYLHQLCDEFAKYVYAERPIWFYLSKHPGVKVIVSNVPMIPKLDNKTDLTDNEKWLKDNTISKQRVAVIKNRGK